MTNRDVADLLNGIGDILEIMGENRFKVIAYRRAAENILSLGRDIRGYWQAGKLQEIPGVGQAIADKLDELFSTGHLAYYERLQEQVPSGVVSLLAIPEVGPKTAKLLWEQLGLQGVTEVEAAARAGKLRDLPGLGARSESKILAGIELLHRRSDRIPLGTAWPVANELVDGLRATCPEVVQAMVAGSLRRMRSTIGDIDLLAASDAPAAVMRAFAALPQVAEVMLSGPTKTTVRLHNGLQADLRVLEPRRWGAALQYFTGSQAHNVRIREIAQKQGLSLSEYGFKQQDGGEILTPEESEVYENAGPALDRTRAARGPGRDPGRTDGTPARSGGLGADPGRSARPHQLERRRRQPGRDGRARRGRGATATWSSLITPTAWESPKD